MGSQANSPNPIIIVHEPFLCPTLLNPVPPRPLSIPVSQATNPSPRQNFFVDAVVDVEVVVFSHPVVVDWAQNTNSSLIRMARYHPSLARFLFNF